MKKQKNTSVKILFLDRDGVINKDPNGYFHKYEEVEYNYDLLDIIKKDYNNYKKIIVTNQSGISRSYFSEETFRILMLKIIADLEEYGIEIDKVYYDSSLPEENSFYRKPNPGMLIKGIEYYNADKEKCEMIGDKETDREAAINSGIKYFRYYRDSLEDKETLR